MARYPSCPECGRQRTAEIVYGSPKLDARLRRRIGEGHAVLGGPIVGHPTKWLCVACGAEFGGSSAQAITERLDLVLQHIRTLTSIDSDLRTAGLSREALALEKAQRILLGSARADAQDEMSERTVAALEPPRADAWSEDETVMAYDLLMAQPGFPSAQSIEHLARTLGRSRGAVARKIAALQGADAIAPVRRRRTMDQRIVRSYAGDSDRLRRDARRLLRLRRQPSGVGPRRRATRATRFEFWSTLNELMDREGTTVKFRPADSSNWKGYSIGRAGFSVVLTMSTREQRVGCELYIDHRDAKHAFDQLEIERSAIERALGPLEWQRLPGKRACRLIQYRSAPLGDLDQWPEILSWCKERVEAFHRVFVPRVRTLVLVKK